MPDEGVVFYNCGVKCLCRLAVAATTLRKHYRGPATVIHAGDEGVADACQIAVSAGVDFKSVHFYIPPGKNVALLGKTLLQLATPYDVSVLLDSDTVTRAPFPELFVAAAEYEYAVCQFSDWRSDGRVRGRIEEWRGLTPDDWIEAAIAFGPAVNTGVFAFRRDSQLQAALFEVALPARGTFIPDEIAVQILLPRYPHKIMGAPFNVSCRYGFPYNAEARIVHFHGRKHCRIEEGSCLNAAHMWLTAFEEVRDWPVVRKHIADDKQLRENLPRWDRMKGKA